MPKIGSESDFSPPNINILDKKWWHSRHHEEYREKDLKSIIDTSYMILIRKIAGRNIVINNEASLQLHFSQILITIGKLYEFQSGDLFHIELEGNIPLKNETAKSKNKKARADILIALGQNQYFVTCAIELKYFKKCNHREPLNRYDAFLDLANLEEYKNKHIDYGYLVIATDHEHYVNKSTYSDKTKYFDLRDGKKYHSGSKLIYGDDSKLDSITLINSYDFKWDTLSIWGTNKNLYCLKIEV